MNFKEELLKKNAKASGSLNLQSLKLGTNAVIALANSLQARKVPTTSTSPRVDRQSQLGRQCHLRLRNALDQSHSHNLWVFAALYTIAFGISPLPPT